jgi:hypothetical protein
MVSYLINKWLSKAAFQDMILNGFVKIYNMQSNALQNMTLMGLTLNKMFLLDSNPFDDEIL